MKPKKRRYTNWGNDEILELLRLESLGLSKTAIARHLGGDRSIVARNLLRMSREQRYLTLSIPNKEMCFALKKLSDHYGVDVESMAMGLLNDAIDEAMEELK